MQLKSRPGIPLVGTGQISSWIKEKLLHRPRSTGLLVTFRRKRLRVELHQGFEGGHLSFASVANAQFTEISCVGQVKICPLMLSRANGKSLQVSSFRILFLSLSELYSHTSGIYYKSDLQALIVSISLCYSEGKSKKALVFWCKQMY